MITLVVLCLLTLELEGSLCKPISLPNMPTAAQKAAKAAAAALLKGKGKGKVAAPAPSDEDSAPLNELLRAPGDSSAPSNGLLVETVPAENSMAGLTASLFQETQVDQSTLVEESPSLAMSPDGQARDSLEVTPHPTPTPSPQCKDTVCM